MTWPSGPVPSWTAMAGGAWVSPGFEDAGLGPGAGRAPGRESDDDRAALGPVRGRPGRGHHRPGAGPGGDQAKGLQAGRDLGGRGDGDAELGGDLPAGRDHVAVPERPGGDLAPVVLDDLHVRRVAFQLHCRAPPSAAAAY